MIAKEPILKVTVAGALVDNVWSGLFYGTPTTVQLKEAMHIDIENKRADFDSAPAANAHFDSIISDWFALVQVVEHGDTLNAGPVIIAKCQIGEIIYSGASIFKEKPQ